MLVLECRMGARSNVANFLDGGVHHVNTTAPTTVPTTAPIAAPVGVVNAARMGISLLSIVKPYQAPRKPPMAVPATAQPMMASAGIRYLSSRCHRDSLP